MRTSFNGTWLSSDMQLIDPTTGQAQANFWPVLFQRAYLQSFNINWTKPADTWKQSLGFTSAGTALLRLYGDPVSSATLSSHTAGDIQQSISTALSAGQKVVATTFALAGQMPVGSPLALGTTYTILAIDGSGNVTLRNPSGIADTGPLPNGVF